MWREKREKIRNESEQSNDQNILIDYDKILEKEELRRERKREWGSRMRREKWRAEKDKYREIHGIAL